VLVLLLGKCYKTWPGTTRIINAIAHTFAVFSSRGHANEERNVHTGTYALFFLVPLLLTPSDRHEMPEDNGLQKQNIKDRYHGRNDPVAKKLLSSYAASKGLEAPEDTSIKSLFLTTLPANATEESVRLHVIRSLPFLSPEDISSVVHVAKSRCAFANFKSRAAAERAAEAWAAGLDMDGQVVGVKWRKSRVQTAGGAVVAAGEGSAPTHVPV
jgi:hypothetical protein